MRYRQLTLICAGFLALDLATAVSPPPPDERPPDAVFVPGPVPAGEALITPLEPEARGGMTAFLEYMVRWERETVQRMREQYAR